MPETIRPDQVIPPVGAGGPKQAGTTGDWVMLAPNVIKLLGRLIRDRRVPRGSKLLVGALVVYLASPIDLVPDFIPVAGVADDVLLAAYALNHLIERAGEEVVLEHWDGPTELLGTVRAFLGSVGQLLPQSVQRWVDRFST